mmetsp:Transcript_99371/g.278244  ORF Transcript_99371/g.278244 Transcript_99371/m.278244 type:complete len:252 (+) Transcript_99371:194-949(+)
MRERRLRGDRLREENRGDRVLGARTGGVHGDRGVPHPRGNRRGWREARVVEAVAGDVVEEPGLLAVPHPLLAGREQQAVRADGAHGSLAVLRQPLEGGGAAHLRRGHVGRQAGPGLRRLLLRLRPERHTQRPAHAGEPQVRYRGERPLLDVRLPVVLGVRCGSSPGHLRHHRQHRAAKRPGRKLAGRRVRRDQAHPQPPAARRAGGRRQPPRATRRRLRDRCRAAQPRVEVLGDPISPRVAHHGGPEPAPE